MDTNWSKLWWTDHNSLELGKMGFLLTCLTIKEIHWALKSDCPYQVSVLDGFGGRAGCIQCNGNGCSQNWLCVKCAKLDLNSVLHILRTKHVHIQLWFLWLWLQRCAGVRPLLPALSSLVHLLLFPHFLKKLELIAFLMSAPLINFHHQTAFHFLSFYCFSIFVKYLWDCSRVKASYQVSDKHCGCAQWDTI